MVITLKIGQSARFFLRAFTTAHGKFSTTERVSVDNEGLVGRNLLKVQSIPKEKFLGTKSP